MRTRAEKSARTRRRKSYADERAALRPEFQPPELTYDTKRDGREICTDTAAGRKEYRRRTLQMAINQGLKCGICDKWMSMGDITFEHMDKRGGGRRNDTIKPYVNARGVDVQNVACHAECNFLLGSKRMRK